jgi:hypothetical protein
LLLPLVAAGAFVSQYVDAVQRPGVAGIADPAAGVHSERNPIQASQPQPQKLSGLLQRADAGIIIKFDLPSPEAFHYAPAVARREISNVRFGHSSKDS